MTAALAEDRPEADDGGLFWALDDVKRATRLSRSTLYRLMEREVRPFPRPFKLDGRGSRSGRSLWSAAEVKAWAEAEIAAARRARP